MASIQKKGKSYYVVYYTTDNDENVKKKKWLKASSRQDASKLKAKVEHEIHEGIYIEPTNLTFSEYLEEFVEFYGESNWGASSYLANTGLINNYINPHLGNIRLQAINTRIIDKFYKKLQESKPVKTKYNTPKTDYIPAATITKIHKLLLTAFKKAVHWDYIQKNPALNATCPKHDYQKRDILTANQIKLLLENCDNPILILAINLSFAASLRVGEVLGLTWDNVHITNEDIRKDNAHIVIEKQFTRINKQAMEKAEKEGKIIKIFGQDSPHDKTRRVLKTLKTTSSERIVWLPKSVAYLLKDWKKTQLKMKVLLGPEEYNDHNLVVSNDFGEPVLAGYINKNFKRLIKKCDINGNYVFHSLRHSSATYKLVLNKGDIKSTQGDTGHAQASMVTDIYAHILDEQRKVNAQRFEDAFYSNPQIVNAEEVMNENPQQKKLATLLHKLDDNPELIDLLLKLTN